MVDVQGKGFLYSTKLFLLQNRIYPKFSTRWRRQQLSYQQFVLASFSTITWPQSELHFQSSPRPLDAIPAFHTRSNFTFARTEFLLSSSTRRWRQQLSCRQLPKLSFSSIVYPTNEHHFQSSSLPIDTIPGFSIRSNFFFSRTEFLLS